MKTVDRIVHIIKRQGAVTVKQLAEAFSITTMGARQHLQTLEDEGIVGFEDVKAKVGRPTRHWSLTSKGHAQFTDKHNELAVQFIDAVENLYGEQGVLDVTAQRERNTLANYQQALSSSTTLAQKLTTLCQLRDEEGYMASLKEEYGAFYLVENHCPICQAATRCPSLCGSEKRIFQTLLADFATVERTEHIVSGQRRCVYRIEPNHSTV